MGDFNAFLLVLIIDFTEQSDGRSCGNGAAPAAGGSTAALWRPPSDAGVDPAMSISVWSIGICLS